MRVRVWVVVLCGARGLWARGACGVRRVRLARRNACMVCNACGVRRQQVQGYVRRVELQLGLVVIAWEAGGV